jgi:hypothetical protein
MRVRIPHGAPLGRALSPGRPSVALDAFGLKATRLFSRARKFSFKPAPHRARVRPAGPVGRRQIPPLTTSSGVALQRVMGSRGPPLRLLRYASAAPIAHAIGRAWKAGNRRHHRSVERVGIRQLACRIGRSRPKRGRRGTIPRHLQVSRAPAAPPFSVQRSLSNRLRSSFLSIRDAIGLRGPARGPC